MRAIALVPLLLALTPRGPHGPIGDMASSGNAFRTLPRHHPALDAPVFRRDEIPSPWSIRLLRGRFLVSPNSSATVGTTSTCAGALPGPFLAHGLADYSPAKLTFMRELLIMGQLGARPLPMADNNFTNVSSAIEWAPYPLPVAPYFTSGVRSPSTIFWGTKLAPNGRLRAYYPALRFLDELYIFFGFDRDKIGSFLAALYWFLVSPSAWLHLATITVSGIFAGTGRAIVCALGCVTIATFAATFAVGAGLLIVARVITGSLHLLRAVARAIVDQMYLGALHFIICALSVTLVALGR